MRASKNNNQYAASIIVPTYNRANLLQYTLQSLQNQQMDESFEVIVVDDGSLDDTKDIVVTFEKEFELKYIYQPDKGFRVARARNLGIALAEAPLCVFVDSSMILDPGCVNAYIEQYHSATDPQVFIGYVLGFDQTDDNLQQLQKLINPARAKSTIQYLISHPEFQDIRNPYYQKYQDNLADLPAPWLFFWTNNVAVPTDLLLQAGGFDENYNSWGVEDIDLGYALFQAGAQFTLVRDALSVHYPHEKKRRKSRHNREYFHKKYQTRATELLLTHRGMEVNDVLMTDLQNDN